MRKYTDIKENECIAILKNNKGFHTDIECPDCNGHLIVREGYTKFLGCSNYPKCNGKIGMKQNISSDNMAYGRRLMTHVAFGDSEPIDTKDPLSYQTWEDIAEDMFPSGINCSDDMY